MKSSNILLSSPHRISTDAESFYRDYWMPNQSNSSASQAVERRRAFVINSLMDEITVGSRILELGVGGEGGIIAALPKSSTVHGIDISDSAIAACQALRIPVSKLNCDSTALPFDNASFDTVVALEVFEHFSNPQFVIEEIRRVLSPRGVCVLSTPAPYTYHWPRLFYPDLFVSSVFHDFLLANRFLPTRHDDPFYQNSFDSHPNLSPAEKSFSLYWRAVRIPDNDLDTLHAAALELFNRRDHHGIRIRPIEALEIFEQCMALVPPTLELTTDYLCAMLYRVINGDTVVFYNLLHELTNKVVHEQQKAPYARALLKIHDEADALGKSFLDSGVLQLLSALANTP